MRLVSEQASLIKHNIKGSDDCSTIELKSELSHVVNLVTNIPFSFLNKVELIWGVKFVKDDLFAFDKSGFKVAKELEHK